MRTIRDALCCGVLLASVGASSALAQFGQRAKLLPGVGGVQAEFGNSLAVWGDSLIVAARRQDNESGNDAGAVYVFDLGTGAQRLRIVTDDGHDDDFFGYSIAADDGTLAVVSRGDDSGTMNAGSVYLFDIATGTLLREVFADDAAAGDRMSMVAIGGGVVLAGVPGADPSGDLSGAAYLFDAASGRQTAKLTPTDGGSGDQFGTSVAIGAGVAFVGAHKQDNQFGVDTGAVYLFDASTGAQLAKLLPADAVNGMEFGRAIAVSGDTIAVTAHHPADQSGTIYLFDRLSLEQVARMTVDDPTIGTLGYSLHASDGLLAAGAIRDSENGFDAGAAYVFDLATGELLAKLTAADGGSNDLLGHSVAISGGLIAAGAIHDDEQAGQGGAVYLFGPRCAADVDGDGFVSTRDFIVFLASWAAGDVGADWNGDGRIDTADFLAFLNDWSAGC